jgi:hypothetical protein
MKSIKIIAVLTLIFLFCLPSMGEKRSDKRIKMKELTDPTSPNYVPYPYPKNRMEIIDDLIHYIKKHIIGTDEGSYEARIDTGVGPDPDKILVDLLNPQPNYRIGEIFKVKNRMAPVPDDYSWLIIIKNWDGKVVLRFAMFANGLMAMYGPESMDDSGVTSAELLAIRERRRKVVTEANVRNILAESPLQITDQNEIKKVQLTIFHCQLANFLFPIWEIKMADGTVYYYNQNRDKLFSVDKRIKWAKKKEGYRPDRRALVPHSSLYLADTLNDELIVLKEIGRNKK